jgi:heme oxygenase
MSKIKELTWEHHQNAERQQFAQLMISGDIDPELYATYLWNQHKKYDLLEAMATLHGLFDDIPEVKRKQRIEADFFELWPHDDKRPVLCKSTAEYIEHMRECMHDPQRLLAHMYVFYMGDLSGGQMIKRKIPGSGTMYEFDGDVKELKEKIRAKIDDSMAEEAKWVFDSATKLFQELMETRGEYNLE